MIGEGSERKQIRVVFSVTVYAKFQWMEYQEKLHCHAEW